MTTEIEFKINKAIKDHGRLFVVKSDCGNDMLAVRCQPLADAFDVVDDDPSPEEVDHWHKYQIDMYDTDRQNYF